MVAAPILIGLLAIDGVLSRGDAGILLAALAAWLITVLRAAHAHRRTQPPAAGDGSGLGQAAAGLGGLLLLVVAGWLIVPASRALAAAWGIDDYVIGATVVALGTSTPELATALVSKLRGHEEVGSAHCSAAACSMVSSSSPSQRSFTRSRYAWLSCCRRSVRGFW